MKTTSSFVIILAVLLTSISCKVNNVTHHEEIDFENAFNNQFISLENNDRLIKYNKEEIIAIIKETADINDKVIFKDFKLVQNLDENGLKTKYYSIKTNSSDNLISVATLLEYTNQGFKVLRKTCKCESADCSWGCEAEFLGDRCSCTSCSAQCTKTSTATID